MNVKYWEILIWTKKSISISLALVKYELIRE